MYSLIREPIKTEFSGNMKQFFLDILFPLIVTVDDEKTFMENDPDGYHQYLNDIIFRFKTKNFRTSAFFLVKTICDEFIDVNNFISSFFLEMLNYILQEGKAKSEIPEYNIFLKNPAAQQDLDLFLCCQLSLKMIYAVPENLHRIAPAAPDNLEYDRELMTIL